MHNLRLTLSRRLALAGGLAWPFGAAASASASASALAAEPALRLQAPASVSPPESAAPNSPKTVWRSHFRSGLRDWGHLRNDWGHDNQSFWAEPGIEGQLLRIRLRQGSIDPGSMTRRGLPRSGTGFKAAVIAGGADSAILRYKLRFAPGFDFVRGGKLPGLFGGSGPSGGRVPQGDDGFSMRLMWRQAGAGEVYAYMPGMQQRHGVSLLHAKFHFLPGRWHQVTQQLVLNTPGQSDGELRLWLDGVAIGTVAGLQLRDSAKLRISGVFVDVFFGGNDDSWASSADTHLDLAEFAIVAPADKPGARS